MSESESSKSGNEIQISENAEQRCAGRFLMTSIGKCEICENNATFKSDFYCCDCCETEFMQIIATPETFSCCVFDDDNTSEQCLHCFLDSFYSNGMKASTVGLKRISLYDSSYLPKKEFSVKLLKSNIPDEMEQLFETQFNKSSYEFLMWICSQEEMLNLTPVDRMELLKKNVGRGRLMWIICESVDIHNVLKLYSCYFDPYDCHSYFLRKIIEILFDYAGYLSYYSINRQLLNYLKILSLFQIGSPLKVNDYYEYLRLEHTSLQRPRDLAMIVMNCWSMMENIGVQIGLMPEFDSMLYSLSKLSNWMEELLKYRNFSSELPTTNKLIDKWIKMSDMFRMEQSICKPNSPELIKLPAERFNLINIINKQYIKSLQYAQKLLVHYIQTADQKTLISVNLTNLVIQQLAWFYKSMESSWESIKKDKISEEFILKLEKLHNCLKNAATFIRIPLLQLILLIDPVTDTDTQSMMFWELQQNFMDKLIWIMRTERKDKYVKEKEKVYDILKEIFRCARYLEKNRKHFPLLFNSQTMVN